LTDSKNVCFTGGANGADKEFALTSLKHGHMVVNASFIGHKCFQPTYYLMPEQLLEADPFLLEADKKLKRGFPRESEYVNSLLRRNYWQIKHTDRVYAVAKVKDGRVQGGTAWAVQMATDLRKAIIYIFDLNTNKWFIQFWNQKGRFCFMHAGHIPKANGLYTGIGTRFLTPEGRVAIRKLYEN
jgi:hypothetical protein